MSAATRARPRPAAPVAPRAALAEDTRAFTIPWRRIALSFVLLIAVVAAWFVTTNTYAVLAQQRLADRWTAALGAAPAEAGSPAVGEAVARISIPSLGLERVVIEGTSRADLRRAPGHQPGTAMPGRIGNSVIRAHRLLWSGPFRELGEIGFGAPVYVELTDGTVATYLVAGIFHMDPDDPDILSTETDRPTLTLVTSDPAFRADRLLVIKAVLPPEDAP
ncbi:MAG: class E sortase [Actinobacteria bacterium]|nr:class E sortase [Actinomycetota bacterium]